MHLHYQQVFEYVLCLLNSFLVSCLSVVQASVISVIFGYDNELRFLFPQLVQLHISELP